MISRPASPSTSESTVSAATTPSKPSDICGLQILLAAVQKHRQTETVNLDQYNQYMPANAAQRDWIAAEEARGRLGVRPQTLYAYVSRGRVQVRPDPIDP